MKRRDFLKRAIKLAAVSGFSVSPSLSMSKANSDFERTRYFSAASNRRGEHFIACYDRASDTFQQARLTERAHQILISPSGNEVLAISRRPGTEISVFSAQTLAPLRTILASDNEHFYGHGLFLDDRYLLTTEQDVTTRQGLIVMRDSLRNYEIERRIPSNGVGPHEIALLSDKRTVVVANGGIATHPDSGRKKLNLDTMSPSLDYIDLANGKLQDHQTLAPELHQLSIRHLAVNSLDQVAVVMQYQGPEFDDVPLVALSRKAKQLTPIYAPINIQNQMQHYCGSVTFDDSGRYFAVSSPRGNLVTVWDSTKQDYAFFGSVRCSDGCGIASDGIGKFMLSNGRGDIESLNISSEGLSKRVLSDQRSLFFDNHLS